MAIGAAEVSRRNVLSTTDWECWWASMQDPDEITTNQVGKPLLSQPLSTLLLIVGKTAGILRM
jgi:hypothetical protein